MDIKDAKTAREFVVAWSESRSPRRRAFNFKLAYEGQSTAASIAFMRGDRKGERAHRAAMRVLHDAERAALCEALGWPIDCVATVSELWQEVDKA